jgi:DNA-binding transcriptional MerR regulator
MRGGDDTLTPEDLVEAAEAARMLGVERSTIRRYEERGRLVPVEVRHEGLRRKPLFRRSDVEALTPKEQQQRLSGEK